MIFKLTFIHSEGSGKPVKEQLLKGKKAFKRALIDTVKLLHDFTLKLNRVAETFRQNFQTKLDRLV